MTLHPLFATLARTIIAVAIALTAAGHAHAQQAPQCTITNSLAIASFGTVTVPRDAALGSAIGPPVTSTVSVTCPAVPTAGFYLQYVSYVNRSALSDVWETGMAGIGVRVSVSPGWVISDSVKSDFANAVPANTPYSQVLTFTWQLVKTAAQVSAGGPLTTGKLLALMSHNIAANQTSPTVSGPSIGNTSIVPVTCSVKTPSIAATLPTLAANKLKPIGTTAGRTAFAIGLSCAAGAKVYVTLTDATTPGNRTNLLTLATGSSAGGVQLQVLDPDVPVRFGADSALPGNANQWLIGDSANLASIPLAVQYVSTGDATPGTVRGLATFTLSYQ